MRKTLILVTAAAMLAGTAITGAAVARDRSDRTELTAGQISDQAAARAAQMKADLRLTTEQEKNWPAFETVVVDMWKKRTEARIAWRTAHAKQQVSVDVIDEMRKDARRRRPTALQRPRRSAKATLFRDAFPQGS